VPRSRVRRRRTLRGVEQTAALEAHRRGWAVVPLHAVIDGQCTCGRVDCPSPGKHPRVRWERYQSARPAEVTVRGWWRRWPDANVGIVTGAVSGLVVLDVDPRHGGDGMLARLQAEYGPLPPTPEVQTGGGGSHLYLTHPGGTVPTGPVTEGLDLKGDGGLVVAPPSRHVSGDRYRWRPGRAPDNLALTPLPAWLPRLAHGHHAGDGHRGQGVGAPLARSEGDQREFTRLWASVGVRLEPGDRTYLCPFHDDHHPSLHVDADGCRWYCFGCATGGGLGRLRQAVGRVEHHPVPPPDLPGVTLATDQTVEVDVVGESSHQPALERLAGGRRQRSARLDTVAALEPEPAARHGRIRVLIRDHEVGHLSSGAAERWRSLVEATTRREGRATCPAQIRGGWKRPDSEGRFGVVLWLPDLAEDPMDAGSGPSTAMINFHGDLADFLGDRGPTGEAALPEATTVKDTIESLGVPHVEVGLVLVDDEVADLGHRLFGGEQVDVHPRAEPWPDPVRFALDGHLGTLARRLRLLGFDTWYRSDVDDADLVEQAVATDRIVLTRDVGLLKRAALTQGAWVRATGPDEQVLQVVDRFALGDRLAPYTRCLRCNGRLRPATTEEAAAAPEGARREHDRFQICADCGRLYWRGTHTLGLDALVARIRDHVGPDGGIG